MNILIIEDETPAANRLQTLLTRASPQSQILGILDSVESAVEYLANTHPDVIFMDIQLADGLSFEIFEEIQVEAPIIFTTAYDQYAIKAFKVNSIDYLLKPIDPKELEKALEKLSRWQNADQTQQLRELLQLYRPDKSWKEGFLIKIGEQYKHIRVEGIAYFMAESKLVFLVTHEGRKFPMDVNLDHLQAELNPRRFFRINRKFIIGIDAIEKIHAYFNSRLKIDLCPDPGHEVIISRGKTGTFKNWLGS